MVTGLSSPQGHLSGMLETGTFADAPDVLASAADVLAAIGAAPTAKPDASVAKPDVPAINPDVPACEFIEIATTNGPELVTVITVEVAGWLELEAVALLVLSGLLVAGWIPVFVDNNDS